MKKIIAYAPHPDDAELFCGGLLAKSAHLGYQTGIIDLTQGELSTLGNLESRKKETEKASKILNLNFRENLKLKDGFLNEQSSPENTESDTAKIVKSIRAHKPDVVLFPYFKARHPDHAISSKIIQKALFLAGVKKYQPSLGDLHRVKAEIFYQMRVEFTPSFICDISDFQKIKMEAVKAYHSQVNSDPNKPETLLSSPLSISSIEARDAYNGAKIGCRYGEAYLTRSDIRIDDPLKHFCSEQNDASLFFLR